MVEQDVLYRFLTYANSEDEEREDSAGALRSTSCSCLDQGMEPCTSEDIVEDWKGVRDSLLSPGGLCSTQTARTPIWGLDEGKKLPDSSIYFGYAGLGRLHCPLVGYEKASTGIEEYFTFTAFSGPRELDAFCGSGLSYWEDAPNPVVCMSLGKLTPVSCKGPSIT